MKNNKNIFSGIVFEQSGIHLAGTPGETGWKNRRFMEFGVHFAPPTKIFPDEILIKSAHEYLIDLSNYAKIVWIGPRIRHHLTDRQIVVRGCDFPYQLQPGQEDLTKRLDDYIQKITTGSVVKFFSQQKIFNYTFPEDLISCDALYWNDAFHLSASGEARMGARFDVLSLFNE